MLAVYSTVYSKRRSEIHGLKKEKFDLECYMGIIDCQISEGETHNLGSM